MFSCRPLPYGEPRKITKISTPGFEFQNFVGLGVWLFFLQRAKVSYNAALLNWWLFANA